MNFENAFICPICKSSFSLISGSLKCENKHSFDIASSGYINLLKPGKMNNAKAGDSKEMIKARSDFFCSGAYLPIQEKICALSKELNRTFIIDAGCGEGYYTEAIAKFNTSSTVLGFDMSKHGCEHGAKSAKRQAINNVGYCVASIFELPIKDSSCDLIINMFAPVASEEFKRVLKPNGHLIVASSGIEHLNGLKSLIYDSVYNNEEKFLSYDGFELIDCQNLKYDTIIVGNDMIQNLFKMTPYYHRTSLDDKKKLDNVSEITTTIEVNFAIYKRI